MTLISRTFALAILCSTTALTVVLPHPVLAQANSRQAPLLPPPPTAALEPIPTPTIGIAPSTPTTNMNGSNSQASPASTKTTTATTPSVTQNTANAKTTPVTKDAEPSIAGMTAAQGMGNSANTEIPAPTTPTVSDMSATAQPASAAALPPASPHTNLAAGAGAPIALPGMPSTEAGLNSNPTGAAGSIDPSLVGADANVGYDQAAYEERLKTRLAEIKDETRQQAVEKAKQNVFPLEPSEIESLLQQLRLTQAATQKPIERPPATPRAVVHTMELDPGAQPPTIQLLNGNVTSLSILDATGQPWPIVDIAFGGPFDVKPPESGGHIIRLSPLKEYAHGNMSVRLQNLPTPLTFSLEAGGQEVHYRFDARIPKLGPHAKTSLINRGLLISAGEDSSLSAILVGTPPASAERLKVIGVDGRTSAYRMEGATYVRTPLTLLSPTWQSSVSSADGTNVYKLNDAPVLLLSDEGVMVRAQVQQPVIDPFGLSDDQKALPDNGQGTQTLSGVRG